MSNIHNPLQHIVETQETAEQRVERRSRELLRADLNNYSKHVVDHYTVQDSKFSPVLQREIDYTSDKWKERLEQLLSDLKRTEYQSLESLQAEERHYWNTIAKEQIALTNAVKKDRDELIAKGYQQVVFL
jgi:hypothetical protein